MASVNGDGAVLGCDGGRAPGCVVNHVLEGSLESYRYYLSRRTVMEMLSDRGYNVYASELSRSLSEFLSEFGLDPDPLRLRICVSLPSKPSKKVMVVFCGTEEIRKKVMCGLYVSLPNKESIHRLILVLQSKMNSFARKETEKYPFKVETFQITDLLVNITKHVLQPKLVILAAEEREMLLRKYKLADKQLPQMLETDAYARYYGLEKGQVVKVSYSGGVAGSLETYRCVV